jgi:hypothetical protein
MAKGAVLELRPDGTGTFTAQVRSTDDDDEWAIYFTFFKDGATVMQLPITNPPAIGLYKFHMDEDDTWYTWTKTIWFPKEKYPQLAECQMSYGC